MIRKGWLALLVLVLLVGLVGCSSGLRTYTDKAWGFSFEYPEGWTLCSQELSNSTTSPPGFDDLLVEWGCTSYENVILFGTSMDEYILVIVMQGDLDLIYTSLTEGYADSVTYVTVGSLSGKKLVTDNNLFIMKGLASKEVVLRGRYVYDLYYTSKLWSDSNSVYFDTVVNSFKEL